jgi:hypothetical protein
LDRGNTAPTVGVIRNGPLGRMGGQSPPLRKSIEAAKLSANNKQETNMAKGNNSRRKEIKKPKKEKPRPAPAGRRLS